MDYAWNGDFTPVIEDLPFGDGTGIYFWGWITSELPTTHQLRGVEKE